MSSLTANVVAGGSLSISVTGTAYLRRSAAAGVLPGVLARTAAETATAGETGIQALRKASPDTLDAIEAALAKLGTGATLNGYRDGESFYGGAGSVFSIEA